MTLTFDPEVLFQDLRRDEIRGWWWWWWWWKIQNTKYTTYSKKNISSKNVM